VRSYASPCSASAVGAHANCPSGAPLIRPRHGQDVLDSPELPFRGDGTPKAVRNSHAFPQIGLNVRQRMFLGFCLKLVKFAIATLQSLVKGLTRAWARSIRPLRSGTGAWGRKMRAPRLHPAFISLAIQVSRVAYLALLSLLGFTSRAQATNTYDNFFAIDSIPPRYHLVEADQRAGLALSRRYRAV
jgi:hypothetical protein